MKNQKGFTLIELMVVIVIIGILSALAIPKMLSVSAKAKASETTPIIANFETLESAYVQETGLAGNFASIGFTIPTGKWWSYAETYTADVTNEIQAIALLDINAACVTGNGLSSVNQAIASGDVPGYDHTDVGGACMTLTSNF